MAAESLMALIRTDTTDPCPTSTPAVGATAAGATGVDQCHQWHHQWYQWFRSRDALESSSTVTIKMDWDRSVTAHFIEIQGEER